ncbi:MAG: ComF family protein [Pseudomonadales bacterium]
MMTIMSGLLSAFSFNLFPGTCILCNALTQRPIDLCEPCQRDLPHARSACDICALPLPYVGTCGRCLARPPYFQRAFAAFIYESPVDRLVNEFKSGRRLVGKVLSDILGAEFATTSKREDFPDLLIPVPLTRSRIHQRGFNQALDIALHVSDRIKVPVAQDICHRIKETPQQKTLSAASRKRILRGAFEIQGDIQGRSIGLVDDVVTTGASASEIARTLLMSGAETISVLALARTPVHSGVSQHA